MDVTNELQTRITFDDTEAEQGFFNLGQAVQGFGDIVTGIIVSDILLNLVNQITQLGEAAIGSSASMQQIGVSAQYAFGSRGAAAQMLTSLDKLSQATPFLNTQLDQVAIRMQEMGVPTQSITNDLKSLANIASATGTNQQDMAAKLQQASDVFATAAQRGSISSIYLRTIANEGIPIYDALVQVINQTGKASVESANAQAAQAKKIQTEQKNQQTQTQQLADAQARLNNLLSHPATSNAAVAADKHSTAMQLEQDRVSKLSAELEKYANIAGSPKYQNLQFQLVQAEAHLKTLGETAVPNASKTTDSYALSVDLAKQKVADLTTKLQDTKTALTQLEAPAGAITKSDLVNGTRNITISFEQLQKAIQLLGEGKFAGAAQAQAETFDGTLKNLRQELTTTTDAILGVDVAGRVQKGGLFDILQKTASDLLTWIQSHQGQIVAFVQQLITLFANQAGPAIANTLNYLVTHKNELSSFFQTAAKDAAILSGFLANIFQLLIVIGDATNKVSQALQPLRTLNVSQGLVGAAFGGSLPHFASGVTNFTGGLALVGEQGPEIVSLPQSSNVLPNSSITHNTVNIHNPVVQNQADVASINQQIRQYLGRQNELARMGAI